MPGGKNERPARRSNRASVAPVASSAPDDSSSTGRRSSRRSSVPQPDSISSSKKQARSASSSPPAAASKREMPARAGSVRAKQHQEKGKSSDVKREEEDSGSEDNGRVQKDTGSDGDSSDEELTSKKRKTSVDLTAKTTSNPGSRRAPAKGRRSVLSQGRARRQPLRASPRSSKGSPSEKAAKEEEDSESEDDDDNETMEDNKEEDNQTKESNEDDDDGEESTTKADDMESKQDDGQPQLRHSTRTRRPAAKLRESSSSGSGSDDDEDTMDQPDVSGAIKRRSSSGGGPAAKRGRRKVLTDANRRPSRTTSGRNSTAGRSTTASRGSGGSSRARASAANRLSSARRNSSASRGVGESDTEAERDRFGGYHSHNDGDDDNSVADHAVVNGDGIGDNENEGSWYKSTAAQKAQRAAENAMLNHAPYLAYPWDDLYLGTHLGSAALNEYLRQQLRENTVRSGYSRGGSVPQFTAQQCLSMVQSLRVSTVVPPPKSELHSVVQPNQQHSNTNKGDGEDYMEVAVDMEEVEEQTEDDDMASEEKKSTTQFFFGPKIPLASMSQLYKTMCEQDVTDGREARRQAQFMTADACVLRLKGMKEKIEQLKAREESILRTSKSLGLAGKGSISSNVAVNQLLGCIPRDDNDLSGEE